MRPHRRCLSRGRPLRNACGAGRCALSVQGARTPGVSPLVVEGGGEGRRAPARPSRAVRVPLDARRSREQRGMRENAPSFRRGRGGPARYPRVRSKQPPHERRIRGGRVGRSRSAGYPRVNRSSLRVLLRDGGVGALRGILASRSKQLPTADALAVAARKRAADPIGAGGSISPRWRAADPSPPALSLKGRGRRTALETGVSQGSPWGRGWGFARPAASRGAPRPKWRSTSRCRRSRGTWPGRSGPACAPARCGSSPDPARASRAAP